MAIEVLDRVRSDQQLKDHWFRRGVAYIIDSLIIFFVTFALLIFFFVIIISLTHGGATFGNPAAGLAAGLLIMLIFVLIIFFFSIAYWVYFDAKGGTPGKRFMKLKPMAISGKMDYPKALIRNGSKIAGGFIGSWVGNIAGGLIMAIVVEWLIVGIDAYLGIAKGYDPRRKFTDFLAETTVIRTDVPESFVSHIPIPQVPSPEVTTHAPAPTTQVPSPSSTSAAPTPSHTTTKPVTKKESNVTLSSLRDSFLMGRISEEEYWSERKKLSDAG
jgi:uncharacterized RDD family membrane protein YckC